MAFGVPKRILILLKNAPHALVVKRNAFAAIFKAAAALFAAGFVFPLSLFPHLCTSI